MTITQEELKKQLTYDPETGLWRWNIGFRKRKKWGSWRWFKGSPLVNGRYRVKINGVLYYSHTLAWLYMYGEFVLGLDHINRDGGDNRIANLRKATAAQNAMNKKVYTNNNSGTTGIRYEAYKKLRKRWGARIKKQGIVYEKYFFTEDEAIEWRRDKERELFGEFAPE